MSRTTNQGIRSAAKEKKIELIGAKGKKIEQLFLHKIAGIELQGLRAPTLRYGVMPWMVDLDVGMWQIWMVHAAEVVGGHTLGELYMFTPSSVCSRSNTFCLAPPVHPWQKEA